MCEYCRFDASKIDHHDPVIGVKWVYGKKMPSYTPYYSLPNIAWLAHAVGTDFYKLVILNDKRRHEIPVNNCPKCGRDLHGKVEK